MIIQILLLLLGSLMFLFSFWRFLKEDYFENQIFTVGFYIFFFVFLGDVVARFFASNYWFWFSFVGMLVGLGIASWRYKMRIFELLEAGVVALFAPIILFLFYDGITARHAASFFAIAGVGLLIGLYYFLNIHYKKFSWYKSGRIGFAGVSVLAVFFILRALLAIWFPTMISFASYEWLISGSAAFLSFLTLFHLTFKTA